MSAPRSQAFSRSAASSVPAAGVKAALRRLAMWRERARTRSALWVIAEDADRLKDLGLTPEAARAECDKAFWE